MEATLCAADPEVESLYPKEEEVAVDYFEWCASFLSSAPKDGYQSSYSSASSTCSSNPPSERSSPSVSPYSSPEQYPPPSPDMQYTFESYPQEEAPRIVVPQVFQTINIGVVQQYPHHTMQSLNQLMQQHPQQYTHMQSGHHQHQHQFQVLPAQNASNEQCKDLVLLDHGNKEIAKRKASNMEVATLNTTELPEFSFNESNGTENRVAFRPSFQLPQAFYRNCYEQLRMKMPVNQQHGPTSFEGYRVYVHPKLGYSGNAKRFKQGPDAGERAFVLDGEILNQAMEPIVQCQACEEYFRDASRRILLIKNNVPIHVRNGEFQLQLKLMCCSSHHHSPFYFHFTLNDHSSKRVVMSSIFTVNVKQWKNMGSSGNKKRKTEDSR